MDTQRTLSENNILAKYADAEAAREVIERLERSGVDAASISLSPQNTAASTRAMTRRRDRAVAAHGQRVAVTGIAAGVVVGAILGFLAGLLAFGPPGETQTATWGIIAFTIGLAVAGAGVGLIGSAAGRMKQSQAWAGSFPPTGDGEFVVGVHSENREEIARAEEVLADSQPVELRRIDAQGRPLSGE